MLPGSDKSREPATTQNRKKPEGLKLGLFGGGNGLADALFEAFLPAFAATIQFLVTLMLFLLGHGLSSYQMKEPDAVAQGQAFVKP